MSEESVRLYIERLLTDEDFCRQISALDDIEKRTEQANAAGYDFTTPELILACLELCNEELDAAEKKPGYNQKANSTR